MIISGTDSSNNHHNVLVSTTGEVVVDNMSEVLTATQNTETASEASQAVLESIEVDALGNVPVVVNGKDTVAFSWTSGAITNGNNELQNNPFPVGQLEGKTLHVTVVKTNAEQPTVTLLGYASPDGDTSKAHPISSNANPPVAWTTVITCTASGTTVYEAAIPMDDYDGEWWFFKVTIGGGVNVTSVTLTLTGRIA